MPKFMRKNEDRKAAELAKLLVSLDALACEQRSWRPRRTVRVALGGSR
jgi:hypothetical protein